MYFEDKKGFGTSYFEAGSGLVYRSVADLYHLSYSLAAFGDTYFSWMTSKCRSDSICRKMHNTEGSHVLYT